MTFNAQNQEKIFINLIIITVGVALFIGFYWKDDIHARFKKSTFHVVLEGTSKKENKRSFQYNPVAGSPDVEDQDIILDLKKTVESLQRTVESVQRTVESLQRTVESLKQTVESQSESIGMLNARLSNVERRVTIVEGTSIYLSDELDEAEADSLHSLKLFSGCKDEEVISSVMAALSNNPEKNRIPKNFLDLFNSFVSKVRNDRLAKPGVKKTKSAVHRPTQQVIDMTETVEEFDETCGSAHDEVKVSAPSTETISYVGEFFSLSNQKDVAEADPITSFNTISDCLPTSFHCPNKVRLNFYGMFNDTTSVDEEKEIGTSIKLSGNIIATDLLKLNFMNAGFYNSSEKVPLDFSSIPNVTIFPGMHMTAQGKYNEQGTFVIENIIEPPKLVPAKLCQENQTSRITVIVATGPFIFKDDDVYSVKLVDHAISCNANALVLIGPFILEDYEPSGENSVKELFHRHMKALSTAASKCNLKVIIIPCYSAFPTPPYVVPKSCLEHNLKLLADPAIFTIGGVQFAVSASGIVDHLIEQESLKPQESENRNKDPVSRIFSQIFSSKSLYPLYPANASLPFSTKGKKKIVLAERPHVMILPSVEKPIIRVVEGCVCLIPAKFQRLKSGVSLTKLEIELGPPAIVLAQSIADYTRVEIVL
uniref:DNA polymerase alpha subunit B n=1 Tax=Ditylenchus dipsaci TaxID=166011 RepID=A0A915EIW1_9BILA